jgi:hypothetical protein
MKNKEAGRFREICYTIAGQTPLVFAIRHGMVSAYVKF